LVIRSAWFTFTGLSDHYLGRGSLPADSGGSRGRYNKGASDRKRLPRPRVRCSLAGDRSSFPCLSEAVGTLPADVEQYGLDILIFEIGIGAMLDQHFGDFVGLRVVGDEH
jgi:hypothetical protein